MSSNTIVLKGLGHYDEGEADATIYPGEAVRLAADGCYDPETFDPDTVGKGLKIAIEDALQGNTVDDAYSDGDILFFYSPLPGDHIQVLVKVGEDIDIGDNLVVEGGGSGKFIEVTPDSSVSVVQLEALEDSGGVLASATLIKCRVLNP
jgi:hypothetical protein